MLRKTIFSWPLVCALTLASCTSEPNTPLTPSGTTNHNAAATPDGSTLKAGAPAGLSPNGGTVDSRRPIVSFNNASGRFASVGFSYDLEVYHEGGALAYSRTALGQGTGSTSHEIETDLAFATTYQWRVRARLDTEVGPWSGLASFRTPDPPVATPTAGRLPFPVPEACGPGDPSNRFACVAAMAALSSEWQLCRAGVGVGCHRFTREVIFALSQSDPNWKAITAGPGGHGCNCFGCGTSDGSFFREDTTVYGGNRVFDMIVGAGGPAPSVNWSPVPGPRAGDIPADAPLCR